MVVLRDIFNDQYKLSTENNADDCIVVDGNTLCKLNQYGVDIAGTKFKLDGTLLTAVPRREELIVYDEATKIKKLEALGYESKGKPLVDFIHDILLAVATECEFTEQKVDRTFIGVMRKAYPIISQALIIGYHRSDGGYNKDTETLYGIAYKNKDMLYKYPEFIKVVNNTSVLFLLGSFDTYYKYCTVRDFSLRGLEKDHITVPYLDNVIIKIGKGNIPFDTFSWMWMDSKGKVAFDLTRAEQGTILKIIFDENNYSRISNSIGLIIPIKHKDVIETRKVRLTEYNKNVSWSQKKYYYNGAIKYV